MSILVVGSIDVDVTVVADRVPAAGETLTGSALQTGLGGKGANQAVAAARAGASAAMVGCAGDDAFADVALDGLHDASVDMTAVEHDEGGTGSGRRCTSSRRTSTRWRSSPASRCTTSRRPSGPRAGSSIAASTRRS